MNAPVTNQISSEEASVNSTIRPFPLCGGTMDELEGVITFLEDQGFEVLIDGSHPVIKGQTNMERAMGLVFEKKPQNWWLLKSTFMTLKICGQDEFEEAVLMVKEV